VVVSALGAPAEIWLNESAPRHHWLSLRLSGTKSNRDAVGARVKLVTKGRVQYDHVSPSLGYASTSLTPLHFGLGAAAAAELVEIHWPSGLRQQLKHGAPIACCRSTGAAPGRRHEP
jgi:hypothetical protein